MASQTRRWSQTQRLWLLETPNGSGHTVIRGMRKRFIFARKRLDILIKGRLRRLEKSLVTIDLPVAELAPPLAEFISIPTEGHYPPASGTPQKRRERILEALLAVLLRVALPAALRTCGRPVWASRVDCPA